MIVYMIQNIRNGKIYIGQTIQPLRRYFRNKLAKAMAGSTNCGALYAAIRKYGKQNFVIIPMITAISREDLNLKEQTLIRLFDSCNQKIGYNLASGGYSATGISAWNKGLKNPYSETRLAQMSVLQKANLARNGHPNKGKPMSQEQKDKIRITMLAKGIRPSLAAQLKGAAIQACDPNIRENRRLRMLGNKYAVHKMNVLAAGAQ